MPADTPAPSALDALLREVDGLAPWQDATGAPFVPLAPRLAAIVRVLRDGLEAMSARDSLVEANEAAFSIHAARHMKAQAAAALARAEAIAKGE